MSEDLYTLGLNGISIGTDTILEKCAPEFISGVHVFANISTLVRNAMSAFHLRNDPSTLLTIKERVAGDIETLRAVLHGNNSELTVYYVPYKKLPRKPLINYVEPKTDKQKAFAELYDKCVEACIELCTLECKLGFKNTVNTSAITPILISHYAHDLITLDNPNYILLESHTGVGKRKRDWNTKINVPKELQEYIPFNPISYYIYGDKGNNYVGASDAELRKRINKLAIKYDWTPMTTQTRMMFCIKQDDAMLHEFLKNSIV